MWAYHGGVWLLTVFPLITVRNIEGVWLAFWGGGPLGVVEPQKNASTVMMHTFEYFDARIDLVSTEKIEKMLKARIVYV